MDDVKTYGLIGAMALILVKEIVSIFKNSNRDHMKLLQQNTIAVVKLEVRMEMVSKQLESLPKLTKDIDYAHSAIREIKNELSQ